jgi:Tat protein translocase TatB subunit
MDSIFGIGMNELVIIFLLAAIVLGPERLVRVAREAGKLIRNLKAYFSSFTDELKTELDVLPSPYRVREKIPLLGGCKSGTKGVLWGCVKNCTSRIVTDLAYI